MPYFKKRPVVIEARQFTSESAMDIYQWIEKNTLGSFEPLSRIEGKVPWPESGVTIDPSDGRMIIATLEGPHWVNLNDWVVRGVAQEYYPVKPQIFSETYEETDEAPTITAG